MRSSAILAAAVVIAVALPVSIALPRGTEPAPDIATHTNLAVPAAAIQPSALPAAAIDMTPDLDEWSDAASQSASMFVVGSLLIGIGSIVRRTV